MADKNYYGKCGSCKHCELGDSFSPLFSSLVKFRCKKSSFGSYVYADDSPCNLYEPDRSRTNDMIARYDR